MYIPHIHKCKDSISFLIEKVFIKKCSLKNKKTAKGARFALFCRPFQPFSLKIIAIFRKK